MNIREKLIKIRKDFLDFEVPLFMMPLALTIASIFFNTSLMKLNECVLDNCSNLIELNYSFFNLTSIAIISIIILILTEAYFILIVRSIEKPVKKKWWKYSLGKKIESLFVGLMLTSWLLFAYNLVKENKKIVIIVILIILGIVLYLFLNNLLAKKIGKEEKKKFKEGQKVKVDRLYDFYNYGGITPNSEQTKKFNGKKVTIDKYLEFNKLRIKEDKGRNIWTEEMFE